MKGIRSLFGKHERRTVRTSPAVSPVRESDAPKNGPLVVMLAASIFIMIGLVILNLRLIRDPSVAGKAFNPSASSHLRRACPVATTPATSRAEDKTLHIPPVVTFYRKLTAQDERPAEEGNPPSDTIAEQDVAPLEKKASPAPATEKVADAKKQDERVTASPPQSAGAVGLPVPAVGSKRYTVQVGAFTHPAVAQRWAEKWKARGFKVSLKPVARPRTGVIYRLYLGRFSSEKKADELVNRLKSKEGISAFRLIVRN